jgi:hypothetical protein
MDLIRALLLNLESWPMERGDNVHIQPDDTKLSKGCSVDQIDYHLDLLMKAGFISGPPSQPMEGIMFRGLTWEGHDFLDSAIPKFGRKPKREPTLPAGLRLIF